MDQSQTFPAEKFHSNYYNYYKTSQEHRSWLIFYINPAIK